MGKGLVLAGIFILILGAIALVYADDNSSFDNSSSSITGNSIIYLTNNSTMQTNPVISAGPSIVSRIKVAQNFDKAVILTSLKNSRKIDKQILSDFNSNNTVRVIVNLDSSNIKNLQLNKQMPKIKQNQNSVLSGLSKGHYTILYQYSTLNSLALQVDAQGLQDLENSPIVKSIQEDAVMHTQLFDSAPIIGANTVWNTLGYTGKGQTVCIVDSGIDYTHPNLGGGSCAINYSSESEGPDENLPHPYDGTTGYEQNWVITKPGYSQIAVHFNRIGLEENYAGGPYDYIQIMDGNNNVYQTIVSNQTWGTSGDHCQNQTDIWSVAVPGDTIKIRLYADGWIDKPANCYGLKIDKVADAWKESVCRNFLGGMDFVNNDGNPMDDLGHGTHVAGIIVSNDTTYRGIAPDANIIAAKVCSYADVCYDSDTAAGIDWCDVNKQALNVSVITLSLGTTSVFGSSCDGSFADTIAINNAVANGIFVDAASGNGGSKNGISAPACASGATPVGATAKDDSIAGYTNTASGFPNYLLAPGGQWNNRYCNSANFPDSGHCVYSEIVSTCLLNKTTNTCIPPEVSGANVGSYFTRKVGTSMAAPHVAGLAALMLQANSTLTPLQIRQIMNSTGVPIYDGGGGTHLYFSRINATAAVEAVMPQNPGSMSITIDSYNMDFTNLSVGDSGAPNQNPLNITVISDVAYNVTTEASSSSFSGPGSLLTNNLQWYPLPSGSYNSYLTSPALIASGSAGTRHHLVYNKLNIPSGTQSGNYNLNLLFKVRSAT